MRVAKESSLRLRVPIVGVAILCLCAFWLRRHANVPPAPAAAGDHRVTRDRPAVLSTTVPSNASIGAPLDDSVAPPPTRAEVAAYLEKIYRQEEVTRELDLAQPRFAAHYWESDHSGPTLDRILARRADMIRQLSAEANAVLATMCPHEAGPPIELTPFFDDDHPVPNIGFLPSESRRALAAALCAAGPANSEQLTTIAAHALSASEFETFWKWNDPAAVALRAQLVGFEPSEVEFLTLLNRNRAFDPSGNDGGAPDLVASLGPQRAAELHALEAPGLKTAMHDLDRLGLPLASAQWLADLRQQGSAAIQQVWSSPALPPTLKAERVRELEQSYGQTIATKLGLRVSSLDELGPVR